LAITFLSLKNALIYFDYYAVVGVQLKDFFDYGLLHQQPNLTAAQLTVAFSHSELIVGDF